MTPGESSPPTGTEGVNKIITGLISEYIPMLKNLITLAKFNEWFCPLRIS
jgi:hypothetical protein